MPAAAVIPAPIAYIKVAAVKKLVVGSGLRRAVRFTALLRARRHYPALSFMFFTERDRRPGRLL